MLRWGGGGEQCTGYIYPHLFLSVNACQSEFNSRVHAWCTCIWTHFFTCKSENLNLCFWICEIIAAPKRLHSSTQKQIVFISFVYTLNTKCTWMQTLWRRNQVIHYVFNFFPIRIRKIHLLVLLKYASTPSTLIDCLHFRSFWRKLKIRILPPVRSKNTINSSIHFRISVEFYHL